MDKEKAEKIQRIFSWVRFVILVLFLTETTIVTQGNDTIVTF